MEGLFIGLFIGFILIVHFKILGQKTPPLQTSETKRQGTPRKNTHTPPHCSPKPVSNAPLKKGTILSGVAQVVDENTLLVDGTKIRLAGVIAPKPRDGRRRGAQDALSELCAGQTVFADLTGARSMDRWVATCALSDGTDLSAELVKQGLALDFPDASHRKYRHLEPDGARQRLLQALGAPDPAPLRAKTPNDQQD